jgi:diadenosine tetraphosphate (Ap4A) HIT family hydrolase
MNMTMEKFGYPDTLLKEFEHWCILMRPAQCTFSALVLASKHEAQSLSELPPEAFTELSRCIKLIENRLKPFSGYNKINYMALMMVDPHVHFHILPRYAEPQSFMGTTFTDPGWPGMADLKHDHQLSNQARQALKASLLDAFGQSV